MTRRVRPGHYEIGRIKQKRDGPRPRKCGTYGAIKEENIEKNGHLEWSHICEGIIKTSRWVGYRIGPGDNGKGIRTDLLKAFDSKKEAVNWVKSRYGNKFDEKF